MNANREKFPTLFRSLIISCIATCTIVITPVLGHDPINIPKAVLLSLHGGALLAFLFFQLSQFLSLFPKWSLALVVIFLIALFMPLFTTDSFISEQIFGTWGRSTGILTYFWLIILLLAGVFASSNHLDSDFRKVLHRVSYFITGYVIVQYADLDPIKWIISAPVATLGNINFTSAFLGLANISFASEIFAGRNNSFQKLHFASLLMVNNLLIWQSGSIQGMAILVCGIWIMFLLYLMRNYSRVKVMSYLLVTVPLGLLASLGSAGVGPLGYRLKQDTVLFRTDYWRAGIEMTKANPLTGIGIDSYGDYYREYRDVLAATRTGPQRITNTAHSVFLDLFSGGGLFLGGAFLILFVLAIALGSRAYLLTLDTNKLPLIGLNFGYFFFCCISINQIGVAVWGFLFLGILIGQCRMLPKDLQKPLKGKPRNKGSGDRISEKLSSSSQANHPKEQFSRGRKLQALTIIGGALASVSLYAPNLVVDLSFQSEFQKKDFRKLATIASQWGAQTYHFDKAIEIAVQTDPEFALELSRDAVARNPRDFYAWATVLLLSTDELERNVAAKELQKIDAAYIGKLPLQQVIDSAILS